MNLTLPNHEWIQDEGRTKSALCFALADLPAEWGAPLIATAFDQVRRNGEGDNFEDEWRVHVKAGEEEHVLIFPAHPQLTGAQAEYPGITIVGLDDEGNWVLHQWLDAREPLSA